MSYYRRLIEESEKKRILGLHNRNRKNPTTGLLKEAKASQADFYCASNVGNFNDGLIEVLRGHDGRVGYSYQHPNSSDSDRIVYLINKDGFDYVNPNDPGYTADSFPGWSTVNGFFQRYWYCKCESGKCKVATSETPKKHECKEPQGQACGTDGGKQVTTPGGQQGGDKKYTGEPGQGFQGDVNACKKQNPYNAAVTIGIVKSMGDWGQLKKDWGSDGSLEQNMKLRDAICAGWRKGDPKEGTTPGVTGTQTPTGEQPKDGGTQTPTGGQTGTEDKKYSEEYVTPTFGQTPKAD